MKKIIMILLAAAAISCTEGNRSSERDSEGGDMDNRETVEPVDTTDLNSDDGLGSDRVNDDSRYGTDTTSMDDDQMRSDSLR